jgi:hypothetical protein
MLFRFTETLFVFSSKDAITEQLNCEFQAELTAFLPTAQIKTYSSTEMFYNYLYFTQELTISLLILYTLHRLVHSTYHVHLTLLHLVTLSTSTRDEVYAV